MRANAGSQRILNLLWKLSQAQLPAAVEGGQPLPEGLMWLLLTGDVRSAWPGIPPQPESLALMFRREHTATTRIAGSGQNRGHPTP